ncbi:hypothetical protein Lal_00043444 [Lupinus albus]|nr:hypothetical protein Lal_00043444 [Lupinus albus]
MFVLSGSMVVVIELSAHSPCHVRLVSFWPGVRLWFLCCLPVKWYSRASYDPFHPDPREVVGGFGSDACDVLAVHSNGLRSHTCLVFPWMRCMRRTWADQFVPLSPFDLSVPLNDTLPWCRSCLTIRGGNTGTWNKVVDGCYLVDPASSHMLVSKIKPCMSRSWTLGWVDRSAIGVHRSARPFCRRCAPGLNWPGRASGAVTLKKLECSKQAYALDTLAWDNTTGF